MTESLQEIFVDFNRRAAEPGSYVTWANQFSGPIRLGSRVRLTDYEDMQTDGYISCVSANGRDVIVTVGESPAPRHAPERHLALRDISFPLVTWVLPDAGAIGTTRSEPHRVATAP